jgi:hypothetical protein
MATTDSCTLCDVVVPNYFVEPATLAFMAEHPSAALHPVPQEPHLGAQLDHAGARAPPAVSPPGRCL